LDGAVHRGATTEVVAQAPVPVDRPPDGPALGVADLVIFESSYLDPVSLHRVVAQADVVVLPYESRDQATSGVLTEAVAAGKPVVATAFPHAVELARPGPVFRPATALADRGGPGVAHSRPLVAALQQRTTDLATIELTKDFGQTHLLDQEPLDEPPWQWPKR